MSIYWGSLGGEIVLDQNVNTSNMERVDVPPTVRHLPPLEVQQTRSPYFVSQVPTNGVVNPDNLRNFCIPSIPSYRIVQPLPLTLSGAAVNTVSSTTSTVVTPTQNAISGTGAQEPSVSDNIQFVSPFGSNTNDGLSWGTARQTTATAFAAIGSNVGYVFESPAMTADGIAATGSATGLNGIILAPTRIYLGPSAQATSINTGVDSARLHLVGSVWNGSRSVDDFWDIYVNSFPGAFSDGSNLIISHSSVEGGSGRILVESDFVIANPRDATSSLNSNSFAFDNQGAYFESGTQSMLWEMANTVNQNGGALNTLVFRQNFVPIFNSAASGAQAEFALGGSGTLGVSGNYSGPPKWLFTNLRGSSFHTVTIEHSATAQRTFTVVDANSNSVIPLASATAHEWVTNIDATGTQHLSQPVFSDISGTASASQVTAAGSTGQIQFNNTTLGADSNLFWDNTNKRLGIGTASPAFGLDVNGTINSSSGFRISGTAGSGHVLRGNGSAFVDVALAAADLSNGVTGSGAVVLSSSPTLTTPNIGTATATSVLGIGFQNQIFTATGSSTFTIPTGITQVKATILGAGGAGGGGSTAASNSGGSGGGAGGVAIKWLTGLTPTKTISVTVGAGGTGVAGGTGNSGGNSSISSGTQTITTITANGGSGGGVNAHGGAGGSATNGDLNFTGNAGLDSPVNNNGNNGASGTASLFCGAVRQANGNTNGNSASVAGAGGGGAGGAGASTTTGGSGGNGIVIFEWVS